MSSLTTNINRIFYRHQISLDMLEKEMPYKNANGLPSYAGHNSEFFSQFAIPF